MTTTQMRTAAAAKQNSQPNPPPITLESFMETLFTVKLREQFAAATETDPADVAYTWGM